MTRADLVALITVGAVAVAGLAWLVGTVLSSLFQGFVRILDILSTL